MKKLPFLFLLFLFACVNSEPDTQQLTNTEGASEYDIEVDLSENPELLYKALQIFPVIAEKAFIDEHLFAAGFKNLSEGINIKGFRITEKKPYGRSDDSGAVNTLTVQNKSQDTIYIMSGDVVQGGQQDRILAQDMVIPPRTIRDIPVFCVERGRWEYRDEDGQNIDQEMAIQNKRISAFTGYYNVASNDLRKTVKRTKDQQAIWKKVGDLTAIHNAESSTGAYTNLENSSTFTKLRNEYYTSFTSKFDNRDNVVGMMVVSGNVVIGADVFSHPDLFKKQYEVLLHAYITDAITNGTDVNIAAENLKRNAQKVQEKFNMDLGSDKEKETKFMYNGKLVHFTDL